MTARAVTVTIDCADPQALASWYVGAFGGEVVNDRGSFVLARLPEMGVNLGFQQVPERKDGKSRTHLDFMASDRGAEVARLLSLGASDVAEHTDGPYTWTVLQDPQGNELCVLQQP